RARPVSVISPAIITQSRPGAEAAQTTFCPGAKVFSETRKPGSCTAGDRRGASDTKRVPVRILPPYRQPPKETRCEPSGRRPERFGNSVVPRRAAGASIEYRRDMEDSIAVLQRVREKSAFDLEQAKAAQAHAQAEGQVRVERARVEGKVAEINAQTED